MHSTTFIAVIIFVFCYIGLNSGKKHEERALDLQKLAKSKGKKWTPTINKVFAGKDENYMKSLMGIDKAQLEANIKNAKPYKIRPLLKPLKGKNKGKAENRNKRQTVVLPKNFDWRNYTTCKSLSSVRRQTCGDCWAVSSAAAISDRYCLMTGENRFFSAKFVETCLETLTPCNGSDPNYVMEHYIKNGMSSGGDSNASEPAGCVPYPAWPKNVMENGLQCPALCDDGSPLDLKYGFDTNGGYGTTIRSGSVEEIQRQIYTYGPVVAVIEIYSDLEFYPNKDKPDGIYDGPIFGANATGLHALRIIGWGVENEVPYWICMNQWGREFGLQGIMKVLRGSNSIRIEESIYFAYAK